MEVRSDDHDPPHVHVIKSVKIGLAGGLGLPFIIVNHSMGKKNARRALDLVAFHQDALLDDWRQIHG